MKFENLPISEYFRLQRHPEAIFQKISYNTSKFQDDNVGHNAICYTATTKKRELYLVLDNSDVVPCDFFGIPKTYYEPFTLDNIPLERLKNSIIMHRHVSKTFQIDSVYFNGFVGAGSIIIDFKKLVNEYVFPNGEPCGTKVVPC